MKRLTSASVEHKPLARTGLSSLLDIRTFESLHNAHFRLFWSSMTFQWAAWNMQMIAKGWFLYELTSSPFILGLMGAAMGVPMLVLSPLGGVLADRLDKRKLLMWGNLGQAVTMLAMALLVSLGAIVWWHIVVASVFQGVFFALTIPSRQLAVTSLVDQRQLMNAMALINSAMNVTSLVAPAAGGFLLPVIGVSGVYYLIFGFFLISAVMMLALPHMKSEAKPGRELWKEMGDGLRYVRRDVVLMLLLAVAMVTVLFAMPLQTLLPALTKDLLDVGPQGLGLLMSMAGLGALASSIALASLGDYQRKGLLLLSLTTIWGIAICLFALARIYPVSLLLMVLVGLGQTGRMVLVNTLILSKAPPEARGRVVSLNMMTFGLQPLGLLPMSALAEVLGVAWVIGIGGAVVAVFAVGLLAFSPQLRKLK